VSIYKPRDGFNLTINPAVEAMLLSLSGDQLFDRQWQHLLADLRQTAHKRGVVCGKPSKTSRLIVSGGQDANDPWRITVVCNPFADRLTIQIVSAKDMREGA